MNVPKTWQGLGDKIAPCMSMIGQNTAISLFVITRYRVSQLSLSIEQTRICLKNTAQQKLYQIFEQLTTKSTSSNNQNFACVQ